MVEHFNNLCSDCDNLGELLFGDERDRDMFGFTLSTLDDAPLKEFAEEIAETEIIDMEYLQESLT